MSTLLSTDMHVKRSTTRVHAPPGGQTTISLNSWGEPEKKKEVEKKAEPAEVEDIKVDFTPEEIVATVDDVVGLAISDGPAFDTLVKAQAKALSKVGIVNVMVVKVARDNMLVRASQKLLNSTSGVIAISIIEHDNIGTGNGSWAQALTTALYAVGTAAQKPVIPGLIVQSSLLEAKALFAGLSEEYAHSIANLLRENLTSEEKAEPVTLPPTKRVDVISADETDVNALLDSFRETLKSRGATGIFGLQRKFKIMDDNNSKSVSLSEFTKAVAEHTLTWSAGQIKAVFDSFDADKSGEISFDEFIQGVRGTLNDRRKQLVLQAFEILDADKSGVVEVNDISAKYNAKKHPDVIAGKKTEEEALREFLDTFECAESKDGKVTVAEFCKYYANLSASIDLDDYFELMIRNAWHISGGEGWCENTSCRRVLTFHADGRQTVEEIKNDLGIAADDKETMLKRLHEQGLTDVVSIDLFGSVDNTTAPVKAAPAAAPAPTNRRRAQGGASTIVLG